MPPEPLEARAYDTRCTPPFGVSARIQAGRYAPLESD